MFVDQDGVTDKVVLVITNDSPLQVMMSRVKKGDTFLDFPHMRTKAGITSEELRRWWAIAKEDASTHTVSDGDKMWSVKTRKLTEEEGLAMPVSCGGEKK